MDQENPVPATSAMVVQHRSAHCVRPIPCRTRAGSRLPPASAPTSDCRCPASSTCKVIARILLANLHPSSRRTFSCESFLNFLAFKDGILDTQISAPRGWPTVPARYWCSGSSVQQPHRPVSRNSIHLQRADNPSPHAHCWTSLYASPPILSITSSIPML